VNSTIEKKERLLSRSSLNLRSKFILKVIFQNVAKIVVRMWVVVLEFFFSILCEFHSPETLAGLRSQRFVKFLTNLQLSARDEGGTPKILGGGRGVYGPLPKTLLFRIYHFLYSIRN